MTPPIHIGFVVLRMDVGGVERSITRLLDGLPQDRFRCTVICLDRSGKAMEWVENQDVQVVELHKKPGWDFLAIRRLGQVIRDQKIDILQSHNWGTLFESVWANRARIARHIHAERGTVLGPPSKSRFKTWLKARLMRNALGRVDVVMSNSYATAEKVRSVTGLRELPITVIPNGLVHPYSEDPLSDPKWDFIRQTTRESLGIGSGDLLIGVVGRLSPVKNFELALRGFALFLKSDPVRRLHSSDQPSGRASLVLVGDGPSRKALEDLAAELGIQDSVRFEGEKKDAWPYYAAMDIFMSTSHSEGMSQSILEAMACGKAIIATDVGDARRMLDSDRCGKTLSQPTAEALRDQIAEVTANMELKNELGKLAYRRFRHDYSLTSMLERFGSCYIRLVDSELSTMKS
ncbi:MAG: glycosyltransferase [Planctomycetota bacterium]